MEKSESSPRIERKHPDLVEHTDSRLRGLLMPEEEQSAWFHCNRYSARAACEHCGGVVRHEGWCIMLNTEVAYAHRIAVEPAALTIGDSLILHSFGAAWSTV